MVFVFVECDLQRVEDEANACFFKSIQRNEFLFELISQDFLFGVKWGAHADLECTSTNDSSAFKAGVLACGLDHEQSTARYSHTADMATLFEPTSLFFVSELGLALLATGGEFVVNHEGGCQREHQHKANHQGHVCPRDGGQWSGVDL